jgi:hypothetical protein
MPWVSSMALIGLLLVLGVSEILLSKMILNIMSKLFTVVFLAAINFFLIMGIIRFQSLKKQEIRGGEEKGTGHFVRSQDAEDSKRT